MHACFILFYLGYAYIKGSSVRGRKLQWTAVARIHHPAGRGSPNIKFRSESVFSPPQCFSLSVRIRHFCSEFWGLRLHRPEPRWGALITALPHADPLAGGEGARFLSPLTPPPLSALWTSRFFGPFGPKLRPLPVSLRGKKFRPLKINLDLHHWCLTYTQSSQFIILIYLTRFNMYPRSVNHMVTFVGKWVYLYWPRLRIWFTFLRRGWRLAGWSGMLEYFEAIFGWTVQRIGRWCRPQSVPVVDRCGRVSNCMPHNHVTLHANTRPRLTIALQCSWFLPRET